MQNSLNQAFIRAYAKERDAVHAQAVSSAADSRAALLRANEELMLRVDTATVEIPRAHVTGRPTISQKALTPALAAGSAAPLHATAVRTEADELRASIASEMLRAGGWQSEQIAALGAIAADAAAGPIATEPTRAPLTKPIVATIAEDAEPLSKRVERDSKSLDLDTDSSRFFTREAARPLPPEYASPSKLGSIVRLDKPLAGKTPPEPPQPVSKASLKDDPNLATDGGVSPAAEKQPAQTFATTMPRVDSAANVSRSHASAEAKQVERELRQAKVRVFNPIWEVDQLQWPEVCVKLMNARMNSLNHVTKHLAEACQEGLQVLAVTSPEGGEGRTTVACCLAMLAGSRGLKVAIVDGDIENPTLSLQTNLEIENDWQSAIMNHLPLEEVSVHSIDDQITLVPLLGPVDQNELPCSDQRIADMLIELSESFDLVILDIGHMNSPNGLMSTLAEQGIINAAIAVIDHRNSSTQRTETCIRRIRQTGVTSIGLVENFAA